MDEHPYEVTVEQIKKFDELRVQEAEVVVILGAALYQYYAAKGY